MIVIIDNNEICFAEAIEFLSPRHEVNFVRSIDVDGGREECLSMWHPYDNMIIHIHSGLGRVIDIIRYEVKIPAELNHDTLLELYKNAVACLKKHGYKAQNRCYPFEITVTDGREVYGVSGRGYIQALKPINNIIVGCGEGQGAICISVPENIAPVERARRFYRSSSYYYGRVVDKIALLSTASGEVTLIRERTI